MLADRIQEVRSKVKDLMQKANSLYGITMPEVEIRFDLAGRNAGIAGYRGIRYYLRFNVQMMSNDSWKHIIEETVPHEVAHIVCFYRKVDYGHGPAWRRTCQALGGNGQRCHSELVTYAKGATFYYTTTSGKVIALSAQRHRSVQAGKTYTLKEDGSQVNNRCSFNTSAPLAAGLPTTPQRPSAGSKADRVRARIQQAQRAGETTDAVVQWAVDVLGMTRGLAKTYVKNNWK